MRELSLNILDIATNSIKAEASLIILDIKVGNNILTISISDNGCGMTADFLAKVTDPFVTTRTTRKVGMGIPLFKMSAISAGGTFDILSKVGEGTTTIATYVLDNIDRMPLGDIVSTFITLIALAPNIDWVLNYYVNDLGFCTDTREIRKLMGADIPLDSPEIIAFLRDLLTENTKETNGGLVI